MNIVHLTASTMYGGPERQMLGLAEAIQDHARVSVVSFKEGGRSKPFLSQARKLGLEAVQLEYDTPRFFRTITEITSVLERLKADVVLCHGYKADILGRPAARRRGIPAVAVSRGWTGESWRVRWYEWFDKWHLPCMDRVVAVSEAQAAKVRRCGVKQEKLFVIPNGIDPERYTDPDPHARTRMERYFKNAVSLVIGAAGRFSPEKGFDVLVKAAAMVADQCPEVGFAIFGDGPCRPALQAQIQALGCGGQVVLPGYRNDLDNFIPQLDLFVLASHTEGMPNVVLEACAAGVPVVATAVGGTPEVLGEDCGWLVPPGDPHALTAAIMDAIDCPERLRDVAFNGRQKVLEDFSFRTQAAQYLKMLEEIVPCGV
ncbi:MAG: glycosyltransferase [Gemmataceae bacterium]|nr:glycosyltransferase [Gemmataceae bacterium]